MRVLGGIFDIPGKEARAAELEEQTLSNEFWQDQEKAQAVLKDALMYRYPNITSTLAAQYGDWFAKLCAASVLVMLGYLYIKASFRRNGGNGNARRNEREIA